MDLPEIKIGQTVDIVVETGIIRPSSVQDVADNRIVFLQITPPLLPSHIGKTILITYLTREDRHIRLCFQARVVDIREGYVTVGRGFPVIIATPVSPIEVCDLRVHERHPPQPEMKIRLGADHLEFIDVSNSGAHLVRTIGQKPPLKVDDIIFLTFENGTQEYQRRARIIRKWHTKGTDGPEHLAVIFTEGKPKGTA